MERIDFLSCPVDNLTMAEAISRIEAFIRSGEPHQVVPVNAAKLWRMERDSRLERIVKSASLIVPEKAIVMGSRVLGSPLKDHIGGIMLLTALLPEAAEQGYRLYFLGARPHVVECMVENLQRDYPGLQVAGWHHGYLTPDDGARVVNEIKVSQPDILFVAMGTPKQEYWIADHLHELGVPVCMGVGGSFDVLAGAKKDAPQWARTLAIEWLYRLLQDPRNLWKRYLITIPWFWYKVYTAKARRLIPLPRTGS
jgi:N-acetylglucosaminyldiphosphoundecaprenol N-acetyl-beta-D-mannosaminyltransferase